MNTHVYMMKKIDIFGGLGERGEKAKMGIRQRGD